MASLAGYCTGEKTGWVLGSGQGPITPILGGREALQRTLFSFRSNAIPAQTPRKSSTTACSLREAIASSTQEKVAEAGKQAIAGQEPWEAGPSYF